jgi:hypothetical protein
VTLKPLLITALILASVSSSAFAQAARSGTAEEQKACAKDVARFCRALMNENDFVILGCLQQNRPKLSASCNRVLVSHGQ